MKIKIKKICKDVKLPAIIDKGEWVDLSAASDTVLAAPFANRLTKNRSFRTVEFDNVKIPLGIAMKLPSGFEAIVAPRSGTFGKYSLIQANSIGIIDNSYSGNNDEWKMPVVALADSVIEKGERICQFRIQLSQKATFWQKIRWILDSKIKFVEVDSLDKEDRGGFGEGTGR